MTRLARPLDQLKPRYDVVIVGSGYGGGVAASRLSRAGKRVAVLERGREVATGEFPSKFPQLRSEMQVSGKRMRTGSATALFDVRLGDDMHVLVGCGLGGGGGDCRRAAGLAGLRHLDRHGRQHAVVQVLL